MKRIVPLILSFMLFACSIPAASASSGDFDQFHGDFQQAMDNLDQLEPPSKEEINQKLEELLNVGGLSQAAAALRVFLDNAYIFRVFMTAFMLSLIGYIFFGKR